MSTKITTLLDITPSDLSHHKMRIENLIKKYHLNNDKLNLMAKNMANKIVYVDKAYGRYLVCRDLGYEDISLIFLNRFKELTYTIHDWRKEKILSLLNSEE